MTYKSAAIWADNNVSKDEFTNFEDWYNFVLANHFSNVEINKTGEFKDLMKEYWLAEMGVLDLEPEPTLERDDLDIAREEFEADKQRESQQITQEIQRSESEAFGIKEIKIPQPKGKPIVQRTQILPTGEQRVTLTRPPTPTPTVPVQVKVSRVERVRQAISKGISRIAGFFRRKKQ